MIIVKDGTVTVTGQGLDVMTDLGRVMASMAQSLRRAGADPEYIRKFFHHLVDIAMDAPPDGTTIDLSFKKEG